MYLSIDELDTDLINEDKRNLDISDIAVYKHAQEKRVECCLAPIDKYVLLDDLMRAEASYLGEARVDDRRTSL